MSEKTSEDFSEHRKENMTHGFDLSDDESLSHILTLSMLSPISLTTTVTDNQEMDPAESDQVRLSQSRDFDDQEITHLDFVSMFDVNSIQDMPSSLVSAAGRARPPWSPISTSSVGKSESSGWAFPRSADSLARVSYASFSPSFETRSGKKISMRTPQNQAMSGHENENWSSLMNLSLLSLERSSLHQFSDTPRSQYSVVQSPISPEATLKRDRTCSIGVALKQQESCLMQTTSARTIASFQSASELPDDLENNHLVKCSPELRPRAGSLASLQSNNVSAFGPFTKHLGMLNVTTRSSLGPDVGEILSRLLNKNDDQN